MTNNLTVHCGLEWTVDWMTSHLFLSLGAEFISVLCALPTKEAFVHFLWRIPGMELVIRWSVFVVVVVVAGKEGRGFSFHGSKMMSLLPPQRHTSQCCLVVTWQSVWQPGTQISCTRQDLNLAQVIQRWGVLWQCYHRTEVEHSCQQPVFILQAHFVHCF